jgi:hypothetical protein
VFWPGQALLNSVMGLMTGLAKLPAATVPAVAGAVIRMTEPVTAAARTHVRADPYLRATPIASSIAGINGGAPITRDSAAKPLRAS